MWEVVGQISVGIGAFYGLLKIIQFFSIPKDKLTATVFTSDYKFPFIIDTKISELKKKLSYEFIENLLPKTNKDESPEVRKSTVYYFWEQVNREIPGNLMELLEYNQYSNISFVTIKNGKTTCENVSINLPNCFLSEVKRQGCEPENLKCNSLINIGDLRPQAEVKIKAWHDYWYFSNDKEISLTHKNGIGIIKLKKQASKFWGDLENDISLTICKIFTFFAMFFAIYFVGKMCIQMWGK